MSSTNSAITQEVVQDIRDGNRQAFDYLFERFREKLLVCCELSMSQRLKSKVDAEDVLQETYAEAYRLFETYRPEGRGSFYRWLAQIATNRIRNLHRHYFETTKRGSGSELSLDSVSGSNDAEGVPLGVHVEDEGPSPSRILMNREAIDHLLNLIAGLPEDLQDVLRLRIYESRTVEETARELSIHKDTVTARVLRALQMLEKGRREQERDRG